MMSSRLSIPTADRISDLPGSILCHILSFLPTKQAAITGILSKRWNSLWLSVLTLDLDIENFKDFECFLKFVNLTLSLRDTTLPIHSFRFKCGKSYSLFNLPSCILKFKSFKAVEVLKFENVQIGDYDQVDFPCVKTLHLSNVSLKYREYIVKFLLGFPILEDLQTELSVYCPRKKIKNLNAIPNLVKVRVCDFYTPMSLVCNAKILYVEKTLWITDVTGLPMFHNLTHLELGFHATRVCYRECTWMLGLLPYFPKLQHLIIQDCVDSVDIGKHYWKDPPVTTVPECLSSQLKICCIRGYRDTECEFVFAKYIMQHSRVRPCIRGLKSIGLEKSEMFVKLSSCIRGSTACKLLLD